MFHLKKIHWTVRKDLFSPSKWQAKLRFKEAGARSKFWGVVRVGGQGGVTTVSNSLILGGWVTKVLKNGDKT